MARHASALSGNKILRYFNSPQHYVPNLTDNNILNTIRKSHHIHILSGSGAYEDPEAARKFAGILDSKSIPYELDIWGDSAESGILKKEFQSIFQYCLSKLPSKMAPVFLAKYISEKKSE